MYYNVRDARYVRDFIVWVKFEDGTEGEIDLSSELWGPVFEPLKDADFFQQVSVAEYGTIAWPNGADLAPEFFTSESARKGTRASEKRAESAAVTSMPEVPLASKHHRHPSLIRGVNDFRVSHGDTRLDAFRPDLTQVQSW